MDDETLPTQDVKKQSFLEKVDVNSERKFWPAHLKSTSGQKSVLYFEQ